MPKAYSVSVTPFSKLEYEALTPNPECVTSAVATQPPYLARRLLPLYLSSCFVLSVILNNFGSGGLRWFTMSHLPLRMPGRYLMLRSV
jgi:hypothetical protein